MRFGIVTALAVLALAGCEWGSEEDAPAPPPETVTVVPIPDGTGGAVLDPDQEQTQAERPEGIDAHEDSKDETPPGVSEADVEQIEESRPAGIGKPQPLGGAENLSCQRRIVRNHSARASGSVVSMFVLHYTVSDPGSLNAIWGLFNTPSFGASSTYLLEPLTGRCELIVDPSRKPWTQGAFNSVSESVEIICCRSDPSRSWWMNTKIVKDGLLAQMVADRLKARGLPNRLVDPSGCTPLAGWTDHNRLECGNSHVDVGRNFPFDVLRDQIERHFQPTQVNVWQVRSGGKGLWQTRARTIDGVSGYDRALNWMRGPGEAKVRAAEKANGVVNVRHVAVSA